MGDSLPKATGDQVESYAELVWAQAYQWGVSKVPFVDVQLREMLRDYHQRFEVTGNLTYLKDVMWYGYYAENGKLLAAIGLQEVTDDGHYLFVRDFVRDDSREGLKGMAQISQFLESLPVRVRGLILTGNMKMVAQVFKRKSGWKGVALLVEHVPTVAF